MNCWRIVGTSRALLHPNWLMTHRQCVYKAVTCSSHCTCSVNVFSFPSKDSWYSNTNFKALRKERKAPNFTNPDSISRNYCRGQVKLNCWNCKQPLDTPPAFFCLSCQVVQPPEEGTSYFKIMDW